MGIMDCLGPKSTIYVPTKQCLLIQTVLSNVMWLLAWAWHEESQVALFIPKSFVCRVCYNSENRLGTTNFCVTICQCLKRMLLPNGLVFKFDGAGTQRKMQKRTFPSLIPAKGAGSVVCSRECSIPVRGKAFLFPLNAAELWELT